jgi:thioredoxin-like negative regulator of GroEL
MEASPSPQAFTDSQWDVEVVSTRGPVLVGFWAAWCVPSLSVAAALLAVAAGRSGLQVGTVDVDAEPGLVQRYRIEGLPTVVLFEDGRERGRRVGLVGRGEIEALLRG